MSMFNNFKIHCLCKMEKTLFVYVFSQFSIDKSANSDYNIITASAKCAKLNQMKGVKEMALYIFLIVAGIAVMAVGHYEENKFISIFVRVIGDALFLLGFNFLLFWNP